MRWRKPKPHATETRSGKLPLSFNLVCFTAVQAKVTMAFRIKIWISISRTTILRSLTPAFHLLSLGGRKNHNWRWITGTEWPFEVISADFQLRLGKSDPAHVPPMSIKLYPTKRPMKVKAWLNPAPRRTFLKTYVAKLADLGVWGPNLQAEWKSHHYLCPRLGRRPNLVVLLVYDPSMRLLWSKHGPCLTWTMKGKTLQVLNASP